MKQVLARAGGRGYRSRTTRGHRASAAEGGLEWSWGAGGGSRASGRSGRAAGASGARPSAWCSSRWWPPAARGSPRTCSPRSTRSARRRARPAVHGEAPVEAPVRRPRAPAATRRRARPAPPRVAGPAAARPSVLVVSVVGRPAARPVAATGSAAAGGSTGGVAADCHGGATAPGVTANEIKVGGDRHGVGAAARRHRGLVPRGAGLPGQGERGRRRVRAQDHAAEGRRRPRPAAGPQRVPAPRAPGLRHGRRATAWPTRATRTWSSPRTSRTSAP